MANVRREDLQVKIPALLHLSRLGYGYLPREQLRRRNRETNILPEVLRAAAERINGIGFSGERFERLMEELRLLLDAEDLGKSFYGTIRDGWNGIRLIDFEHPENNLFQSAAELPCGSGAGSFRPDITLFVNGLPLAMIEVKTSDRIRGLQAEFDRMLKRSCGRKQRRYLQCAQVWAFSDDHREDPDRLFPTEGTFYATVTPEDFPVYAVHGKPVAAGRRLFPRNAEAERLILEDNGIPTGPQSKAFRKSVSPDKSTHRMLTGLFLPERFLFLLRYGIRYVREADLAGKECLTRRMLTAGQIAVLRSLAMKAGRGFLNWTAAPCGAAGEQAMNASLVALLRDIVPGARVHWVSEGRAGLMRDRAQLESCGILCTEGSGRTKASEKRLILMTVDEAQDRRPKKTRGGRCANRDVYVLPQPVFRYGQKESFRAGLRKADPEAILVTRKSDRSPESGFSAVLMKMEVNR